MATEETRDNEAVEEAYNRAVEEIYENNKPVSKADKKAAKKAKKEGNEVLPIEEEVASGDENKTWTQKHKKALIITAIVLVVLIAGCIIGLIAFNNHYQSLTQGVMLYQSQDKMMREKLMKDAVYSEQYNAWNFNEEGENNDANPSAATTDGKYLYYAENNNGTSFDLYYSKIKFGKPAMIASAVTDYEIAKTGVIYYAAENALYCYNVKEETVTHVCNDVNTFRLNSKKDKALLLGGSDGKLSTIELGNAGSLTTLETGVNFIEEASDDFKTIVYGKEDGLYFYNAKDSQKALVTKAYTECYIYNIDKKCEIYYLTEERGLYYFKEGASVSELVSTDVWQLHGADTKEAMFFAAVGPISQQCNYKLINGGEAIAMKDVPPMELGDDVYVNTSENKVYFIGYERGNTTVGTLYAMGYQLLDKGKVEVKDNSVISIEDVYGKKMFICKDAGNNSADLYCDGVLVARNIIPDSLSMTADEKAYVFEYQIADANGDRKLALYDGATVTEVGSCVGSDYYAVTSKEIYFMQYGVSGYNYVEYNGRKVKTVVEQVQDIYYLYY